MGNMWFDLIFVFLGVNNLSSHLGFRHIQRIFTSRYLMTSHLLLEFCSAQNKLRTNTNNVIICELVGLNFGLYNLDGSAFLEEQTEIDSGIILLNQHIRELNNQEGVFTPNIADFTHKQRAELDNLNHRYRATTHDDIHFTKDISTKILDRFIIAIIQQIN